MFFWETFPSCPGKATFSRWRHGATIHSFNMYVERHPHGSLHILSYSEFYHVNWSHGNPLTMKPTISFQYHFFIHSKPQCMLKSCTQSVHLLCQSSSFEGVYSFLLCIQPLYPHGYQKILFLERKMIIIHVVNSGDKCLHITS